MSENGCEKTEIMQGQSIKNLLSRLGLYMLFYYIFHFDFIL